MIITLTGNLLAERTLVFPSWQPGKTQRATSESFQVGGKGINVSRMLIRLGAPTTAVCFAGGAPGDECVQWLASHGIAHHAFRTGTPTRTGTVVRTADAAETTFLGRDVAPDSAALAACAAWLDQQPSTAALAICGSFPGWLSPEAAPLRAAVARRVAQETVYVDTYGPALAWFVSQPVQLVKINRHEFDALCAVAITERPEIAAELSPDKTISARLNAARRYWPVRNWVITDGPGAVWYASVDKNPPASLQPPTIREVSATGSGDVLFAAILHNLINIHITLAEALAVAIPYASANASKPTIADINII